MIPLTIRNTRPMLAVPTKDRPDRAMTVLQREGCLFQPKWDGQRCLVLMDDRSERGVELWSRDRQSITHQYPEIVDALRLQIPVDREVALDGELVCFNREGVPSFGLMQQRMGRSNHRDIAHVATRYPATFIAFDLLWVDGVDWRKRSLEQRIPELENLTRQWKGRLQTCITTTFPHALWEIVEARGMEGLVAKRPTSVYESRRSPSWVKIKRKHRVYVMVTGVQTGKGSRTSTFGALHMGLHDGKAVVEIGKVGSGFTQRQLFEIQSVLDDGLKLAIEVECVGVGSDGRLRHPVFVGVVQDPSAVDLSVKQLEELK